VEAVGTGAAGGVNTNCCGTGIAVLERGPANANSSSATESTTDSVMLALLSERVTDVPLLELGKTQ
jgi:hypothetical protein